MAGGIEHSLPTRLDQGFVLLTYGSVTHAHDVDNLTSGILHLCCGSSQPLRHQPCALAWVLVEPGPKLTLLGAGKPDHIHLAACAPLDQGQGLEHRIVQMGSNLRPFGLPDPTCPFTF